MPEDKKKVDEAKEDNEFEEVSAEDLNIEKPKEREVEEKEEDNLTDEEKKIKELEDKIAELEDTILRNEAQYQNIKKRMDREKQQAVNYANERFASDMLNVIDSLENGAKSFDVHDNGENSELYNKVKEGFDLTLEQFNKVFEKHHISPVEEDNFDPNFHNAIMQVDSEEHEEGQIVQTLQKGYKIKDRVLRAAMVSVAK